MIRRLKEEGRMGREGIVDLNDGGKIDPIASRKNVSFVGVQNANSRLFGLIG